MPLPAHLHEDTTITEAVGLRAHLSAGADVHAARQLAGAGSAAHQATVRAWRGTLAYLRAVRAQAARGARP